MPCFSSPRPAAPSCSTSRSSSTWPRPAPSSPWPRAPRPGASLPRPAGRPSRRTTRRRSSRHCCAWSPVTWRRPTRRRASATRIPRSPSAWRRSRRERSPGLCNTRPMPAVLICADTVRSPEMRHEVPAEIMDPFLYAEVDGHRYAVVSQLEVQAINEKAPDIEVILPEQLGWDELVERHHDWDEASQELVVRACRRMGITEAVAPGTFPLELGDRLREAGLELTADHRLFEARRRTKNADELAGIARAQRAAEAAMSAAAALLRDAEPADGQVRAGGEPVTSERLKAAMDDALRAHPVTCEEPIVACGPQAAKGHDHGSGPVAPGMAVVIDIWPQDRDSACFADMTRTFVVGEPPAEIREWHALCREALERSVAAIRPGITGREVFEVACDYFHEHGQPTQLTKAAGETLEEGFNHSLGHGVGLQVHEDPSLGRTRGQELVAGDVLAVEPGLYRPDIGGVRLEDLVLVTEAGAETLTRYAYDLEP